MIGGSIIIDGTNTVLSTEIDTEEQAAGHEKYKGQY